MTEAEWLDTLPDSRVMLDHLASLEPRPSRRKTRLCMIAFCRAVWHVMTDERCRHAVEVAEQFADDPGVEDALKAATKGLPRKRRDYGALYKTADEEAARSCTSRNEKFLLAALVQVHAFTAMAWQNGPPDPGTLFKPVAFQAEIIQDIFGNPFRPVAFAPAWRTSASLDLAGGMYESRDFAAMPILADALEEAGCDNAEVLAHCRGGGPHVRGCWVVDLVLGKQ
jgi:hypothetical protein